MDFAPSHRSEMIRKMVHEFAERELRPDCLKWDEEQTYPDGWVPKLGELGLLGVFVPETYGGAGLDAVSYAIAIEELSWGDASAGVLAAVNNGLACDPILRWGTEEQRQGDLPNIASGEWLRGGRAPGAGAAA